MGRRNTCVSGDGRDRRLQFFGQHLPWKCPISYVCIPRTSLIPVLETKHGLFMSRSRSNGVYRYIIQHYITYSYKCTAQVLLRFLL